MTSHGPATSSGSAEVLEALKNFSGAVSSALVFLEGKYRILHVNPKLRDELDYVSAIIAVVAGFGAHQFAKRSKRLALGWIFLSLAIIVLISLVGLIGDSPLSPEQTSLAARAAYLLFFTFLGGAIGGFLR